MEKKNNKKRIPFLSNPRENMLAEAPKINCSSPAQKHTTHNFR